MKIGNREFDPSVGIYLMGIVNVTPDSFSDGGKLTTMDKVLFRVKEMIEEGADLLDLGGESTRPGAIRVSEQEEMERVLPVIERIKREFDIPLSLDTYKANVAYEGLKAGIDLINDVTALGDPKMAEVIANHDVPCCLMHNKAIRKEMSPIESLRKDCKRIIDEALLKGIEKDKIILDPGIGFEKDCEENLAILKELHRLVSLGFPVLLGVSRKRVIGETLNLPVEERLYGTIGTNVYGAISGCSFLRVHDIKPHRDAIDMIKSIRSSIK